MLSTVLGHDTKPGNPKSRATTIPAFYREQRLPLVRTLAGPEAEAEVAEKWGEAAGAEAAEHEAAAREGPQGTRRRPLGQLL